MRLLLDLGKYQDEWQEHLLASVRGEEPAMVPHAIHGAAYAWSQLRHLALAFVVLGHHAGLKDMPDVREKLKKANHLGPACRTGAIQEGSTAHGVSRGVRKMAKPREPWNIRPAKKRPSVTISLKNEVETKARELIENVLKPRHVHPPKDDEQFNYITDLGAKWFSNDFYFF